MLPRRNRLTQRTDFQKVMKGGKMVHGSFFAFSYLKTEDKAKKIGIIVSNKISKLATERNLIKRAVRFAGHKKLDSLPGGILGVFLAKKEAAGPTFKELHTDAADLLEKTR